MMPFPIVLVVIAAIGLQQLHFVASQAPPQNAQPQPSTTGGTLPYAGSLYNCGETNSSADNAGQQWNYVFRCKQGDMCVYGTCVNCPPGLQQTYNPYNNMPFLLQCSIVKSVIDRCKVGANGCDQNFDLNRYCGYAFTRTVDGQTYYWNCQNGGNCVEGQCANGGPVVITRCNKAGLYVNSGQCQNGATGTECNGVQCMNMTYQYTGGQL